MNFTSNPLRIRSKTGGKTCLPEELSVAFACEALRTAQQVDDPQRCNRERSNRLQQVIILFLTIPTDFMIVEQKLTTIWILNRIENRITLLNANSPDVLKFR